MSRRGRVRKHRRPAFGALVATAVLVLLSAASSGCSEPLDFADWTIEIPEGTRVIEYPGVPVEERTELIELIEDLVLGGDPSDPDQMFYRPTDIAVDDEGRLFVVDSGNHRIQVFDADGSFVRTLGREGQGPGEFSDPRAVIVVGDRLLVIDAEQIRMSVWSTDGVHIDDVSLNVYQFGRGVSFLASPAAGNPVVVNQPFHGPDRSIRALSRMRLDGELDRQYVELELDRTPTLQRGNMRSYGYGNPRVVPSFAADHDGNVYVAPGDEYQILSLAPDGSARWALRVAWQRSSPSGQLRKSVLDAVRENYTDASESEINYLDLLPSIVRLAIDGQGRLYVYPYVEPDPDADEAADQPVDVYAPDGRHLFSGWTSSPSCRRAKGEFFYGAGLERDSGEYRVKRWRLEARFD